MDLSLKRILAYIVDILIVTIFTMAISKIEFLNPYDKKYNALYNEYTEFIKSNDITNKELIITYNHDLYEYRIYNSIISITSLILYFGVLEYIMGGQTLGKKLFRIKVVSNNGKELTMRNHIIKVIILNSILLTVFAYILLYFCNANTFFYGTNIISLVQTGILLVIILMLILRSDCRGLHDIVSNTRVIDLKNIEKNSMIE